MAQGMRERCHLDIHGHRQRFAHDIERMILCLLMDCIRIACQATDVFRRPHVLHERVPGDLRLPLIISVVVSSDKAKPTVIVAKLGHFPPIRAPRVSRVLENLAGKQGTSTLPVVPKCLELE